MVEAAHLDRAVRDESPPTAGAPESDAAPRAETGDTAQPHPQWQQAVTAARVLAVAGPELGGIRLRARAGPVRDAWLAMFRALVPADAAWLRVAPPVAADALLGGVDLAASLTAGEPVETDGLLARAHGGVLTLAMAERLDGDAAAIIASALEDGFAASRSGTRHPARFCLVALDEGAEADEHLPHPLHQRLALDVDLDAVSWRDCAMEIPCPASVDADRRSVTLDPEIALELCRIGQALGGGSIRADLHLHRVARIVAALAGRETVSREDAAMAARLCLGLKPSPPQEQPPDAEEPAPDNEEPPEQDEPDDNAEERDITLDELAEILVASVAMAGSGVEGLAEVSAAARRRGKAGGRGGAAKTKSRRGRPCGIASSPPLPGARPDIVATLRAAAPWQKLRRQAAGANAAGQRGIIVLPGDFRYRRHRDHAESTAIFVVDASGSTALERLGEAKGAIELLLADCYVRRDSVAMIAFRGEAAEIMLAPTRSLVRAKRGLSGLPGGGGTPLASGIANAIALAGQVERHGASPLIVFLTDGKANVALDGAGDRERAREEAHRLARQNAALGYRTLFIDIARRPRDAAREIAEAMGAEYRLLPNANAAAVSQLVGQHMQAA